LIFAKHECYHERNLNEKENLLPQLDLHETHAEYSAEPEVRAPLSRRLIISFLSIAAISILSFLWCLHLVQQARSQGFVLQEIKPLMDTLIGWGKSLYWLGGRPLFVPAILGVAAALAVAAYAAFRKDCAALASNRRLLILALAFALMYIIGGTSSFALYIAGIIAVILLGWFSEFRRESVAEPAPIERKEKALLGMILLLGLLLRMYQVDVFPRLYTADEQLLAQVVLELGERPFEFFSEPHIMKPHLLRIAGIRLAFMTLGTGLFQQRAVSVFEGTTTILLVYLLGRSLWGNRAGMFSAFLLAIDPWHIGHSKAGVHNIEGPLFLALLLLLIMRTVRQGSIRNLIFLGAVAGATVYLYLSCVILAPFAVIAAIAGRYRQNKLKSVLLKEAVIMVAAAVVVALPYFTVGRENIRELESFYTAGGNFLTAAKEHGWNPLFVLFVNSWNGIEHIINWTDRSIHPAKTFYPNPVAVGLALLGVGTLIGLRKKFEHVLVLLVIPIAWLPMSLSYGFAERRLFSGLLPVPALLGGLILARLWEQKFSGYAARRLSRALFVSILIAAVPLTAFIVYSDADPMSGGRVHPRKTAEYIGSLPPEYSVFVSNPVKDIPFLVCLASYDRLKGKADNNAFSFVSFEMLDAMAEKIALTPNVAVVMGVGAGEREFLRKVKALNPDSEIVEADEFLACLIHKNTPDRRED